jgi:hypothetical protein
LRTLGLSVADLFEGVGEQVTGLAVVGLAVDELVEDLNRMEVPALVDELTAAGENGLGAAHHLDVDIDSVTVVGDLEQIGARDAGAVGGRRVGRHRKDVLIERPGTPFGVRCRDVTLSSGRRGVHCIRRDELASAAALSDLARCGSLRCSCQGVSPLRCDRYAVAKANNTTDERGDTE